MLRSLTLVEHRIIYLFMLCLNCEKEFTPNKFSPKSKFCSTKCRVASSRKGSIVTSPVTEEPNESIVTDNVPKVDKPWTNNWEAVGCKSKDEALYYILACLADNPVLEGAVFHLKGKTFIMKNRKAVEIV